MLSTIFCYTDVLPLSYPRQLEKQRKTTYIKQYVQTCYTYVLPMFYPCSISHQIEKMEHICLTPFETCISSIALSIPIVPPVHSTESLLLHGQDWPCCRCGRRLPITSFITIIIATKIAIIIVKSIVNNIANIIVIVILTL